jgi:hypothetical protein
MRGSCSLSATPLMLGVIATERQVEALGVWNLPGWILTLPFSSQRTSGTTGIRTNHLTGYASETLPVCLRPITPKLYTLVCTSVLEHHPHKCRP